MVVCKQVVRELKHMEDNERERIGFGKSEGNIKENITSIYNYLM